MSTSNNNNSQASSKTKTSSSQQGSGQQETTMPSTQFAEGSANVAQDTQTQAVAYLFGLLPSQDSQQFERQIEDDSSCRNILNDTRGFQEALNYWNEVPCPPSLADRTLSLIQKQIEEEHVSTVANDAGPSA